MGLLKQLSARWFGGRSTSLAKADEPPAAEPPVLAARTLRVVRTTRETPDAQVLWFEDVSGVPVTFQAGQFLTFQLDLGGERISRSYSLCTDPGSGELAVAVKRVTDGRASNFLNDQITVGQLFDVRGPSGRFVLPRATGPRRVVLIAGGSGITPLLSHARHLLSTESDTQVVLVYGNRSESDVIFRAALTSLQDAYPARFVLRHVLSQPGGTLSCTTGMLDQQTTTRVLSELGATRADDTYLVCGPTPMMEAVEAALTALLVPRDRVLLERFTAPQTADDGSELVGPQVLAIQHRGKEHHVSTAEGETVLEAALRSGVPLDFSCATGDCGTCMMRLVEGAVKLGEPNCLTATEREQGIILPCVSRATSACRIIEMT